MAKLRPVISDAFARLGVLTTLQDPAVDNLNFQFGSTYISSTRYEKVRNRVLSSDITVHFESGGSSASYDHDANTLVLAFGLPGSLSKEALIVHEATHAAQDISSAGTLTVGDDEGAAYVAQCAYARQKSTDPSLRLTSSDPDKDKVFELAWELAQFVIDGTELPSGKVNDLKEAVNRHPYYRNTKDDETGYNGVPKK